MGVIHQLLTSPGMILQVGHLRPPQWPPVPTQQSCMGSTSLPLSTHESLACNAGRRCRKNSAAGVTCLHFLPESWKSKMGPCNSSYLSNIAIFHFHDYGRKSIHFMSFHFVGMEKHTVSITISVKNHVKMNFWSPTHFG